MYSNYWTGLNEQIDQVFKAHHELYNIREQYPWLIGALGEPYAGIWFVGENPSQVQIERFITPDGGPPTAEAQWSASRGDKLLRNMLVKYGFKKYCKAETD